jgi:integrase
MGLGPLHTISLSDARERALQARKQLSEGIDPLLARQEKRSQELLAQARSISFRDCAEKLIESHESGWRNADHRRQWRATLQRYVFPVLGDLPVGAVDTVAVLKVLEPIWKKTPETASRVRGRIEAVLNWASARGYRTGENPARWRGHLDHLLPARTKIARVKHHPALPYRDVATFMAELRKRDGASFRALEFCILTATRTRETLGARWSEIDGDVWTIPAERMKGGRAHRVPLTAAALALLGRSDRTSEFVFPGARPDGSLNNAAMLRALGRMGHSGLTVHGFRSTFRDWAAETTNHPNHVVEMALAHEVADEVEAAYRRGDLFEKRQTLMKDWATYCNESRGVRAKTSAPN